MDKIIISGYEAMTVGELIAQLSKYPANTPVVYRACSDWNSLRPEDVELVTVEQEKVAHRGDRLMSMSPYNKQVFGTETPKYVTVVTFPGN